MRIKKAATITRAVIVGISDYEDDQIPDLRFAHKDATAFAEYLTSPAGGSIPEENVKLLTNEKATGGNIHKALYWLVKESVKNDDCIIYFSGHGDVETIYEDEPGHFLAYDSPSSIYQINSLRIDDLKRIISTLSNKNGARVVVFTDACRAGKLAGSEINGTQATAAALANQFANEVKIMSCQSNEFSVEGEQWGGGRGIFSYHLIDGLVGMADVDNNKMVDLKELRRYLEDRFDDELEELNQTPVIVGDKNSTIAEINEESLLALKSERSPGYQDIAAVDEQVDAAVASRTVEDDVVVSFYSALNKKRFLNQYHSDTSVLKSAEFYFDKISDNPDYADKLPIVKGDFISALQDDAQNAINKYLKLEPSEMQKRFYGDPEEFGKFSKYLSKAVVLLGETHYLYPQIKAKEIYFEVLYERLKLDQAELDTLAYAALHDKLADALIYQQRSPFIYNELGLLYLRSKNYPKAIEYFDQTIEMSPKWAMPYSNKSNAYKLNKDYLLAIENAQKALELNWELTTAHGNIASILIMKSNGEIDIDFDVNEIQNDKILSRIYDSMARKYIQKSNINEAKKYLKLAIEKDESYGYPYFNLGYFKMIEKEYQEAIDYFILSNQKGLETTILFSNLGVCYGRLNNYEQAINWYLRALEINPSYKARLYLAMAYLKKSDYENAKIHFEKHLSGKKNIDKYVYFDYACVLAALNDLKGFKENMLIAIEMGFKDIKEMEESNHLSSIKTSTEYKYLKDLLY